MVRVDFDYNGVSYIGYETRTLHRTFEDNVNIIQFFCFKTETDVDTIYININNADDSISVIVNEAVTILTQG
jgi:hypothetical protein